MKIDWDLIIKIVIPLLMLLLGHILDRVFARKPKLISYLGHVSAFTLNNENQTQVFTHAIVVRNTGRETANNVRIGHFVLPSDYQIYPSIPHAIEPIPRGGAEIVIPKLIPGEQLTISYLYFPPLTWDRVNSYTKSDEAFAKILRVIPAPQLPKGAIALLWMLIFIVVTTIIYFIVQIVMALLA